MSKLNKILCCLGLAVVGIYATAGLIFPEPEWKEVYGLVSKNGEHLYFDSSTLIATYVDHTVISGGDFLITLDKPTTINVDGKTIMVTSMMKGVVMNCKTGIMSAVYEMYFNGPKFPSNKDAPIHSKEFGNTKDNFYNYGKKTPVYSILCPVLA